MLVEKYKIQEANDASAKEHRKHFEFVSSTVNDAEFVIRKLTDFQIAIPSWALGAGGTRFGRFSIGGEPRTLEEKIEDVGLLHSLNQASGAISLHIPLQRPALLHLPVMPVRRQFEWLPLIAAGLPAGL